MAGRQLIPPVFNALVNDDKTCDFQYRKFLQGLSDDVSDLSSTVDSLSSTVSSLSLTVHNLHTGYGLFIADLNNSPQSAYSATKINLGHAVADPDGVYDAVTNYRYQPLVNGYYHICLLVYFKNQTLSKYPEAAIYKNGSAYAFGTWTTDNLTESISLAQATVLLNGSTDYIEGFALPGTTGTIDGTPSETYMTGWLVRSL